jgi:hypothetical protein
MNLASTPMARERRRCLRGERLRMGGPALGQSFTRSSPIVKDSAASARIAIMI